MPITTHATPPVGAAKPHCWVDLVCDGCRVRIDDARLAVWVVEGVSLAEATHDSLFLHRVCFVDWLTSRSRGKQLSVVGLEEFVRSLCERVNLNPLFDVRQTVVQA
jgi:hypothetical protein